MERNRNNFSVDNAVRKIDELRSKKKSLLKYIEEIEKRDDRLVEALIRLEVDGVEDSGYRYTERTNYINLDDTRRRTYVNNEKTELGYWHQLEIIENEDLKRCEDYHELAEISEGLLNFGDPLSKHLSVILRNCDIRFHNSRIIYSIFQNFLGRTLTEEQYYGYLNGELPIGHERILSERRGYNLGSPIYINKSWKAPEDAAILKK
ncbi:hypothetical protein KAT36_04070 [Candidatus Pacearchaeota archaeon]|nr:hypothetical protein [Candidatus Pacearchaeota archaeon]